MNKFDEFFMKKKYKFNFLLIWAELFPSYSLYNENCYYSYSLEFANEYKFADNENFSKTANLQIYSQFTQKKIYVFYQKVIVHSSLKIYW